MKIAMTGASGFVGSHLVLALAQAGHTVRALKNRSPIAQHGNIQAVRASLSDIESLEIFVEGCDLILHCGALVAAKTMGDFKTVNTIGTQNLIAAAEKTGVQNFLFVSSMAAREAHLSPYAASKAQAEEILKNSNLNWDIIRPPAVYGDGDLQMLKIFKLMKAGIALTPAGSDARVSAIYISDLVEGIMAWIAHMQPSGKIYEVAGLEEKPAQQGEAWKTLLETIAQISDAKPKYVTPPRFLLNIIGYAAVLWSRITGVAVFISPGKVAEMCHKDWVCHDRSFEQDVNWQPKVNFKQGILKTYRWYKQNGHI